MNRLSSPHTSFLKRVTAPSLLVIVALIGCGVHFLPGGATKPLMFLPLIPAGMVVCGYFVCRLYIWDLVDEVVDHGEYLSIRNKGQQDSVLLSNVMNVESNMQVSPPRITLRLRTPCKFGDQVAFFPVSGFWPRPFSRNKIAEGLIVRIDQNRTRVLSLDNPSSMEYNDHSINT